MQVAQVNDHITHAVIGGEEAMEFGISSSAEFFHILSSTLYSDQPLAVVREVLCNAWDAHKDAGRTDIPIKVTITGEKFMVQDFGLGIPKDQIGPIYGTYGNSTKKNDGGQTGGFGLGCKAPFAYTDHFEVTSCHGGIRTIYAMSKSSAQVNGKPGITPIVSMPTTETGLTVSLAIKSIEDFNRFSELIARIARNGEMNMLINNKQADVLKFSECKEGYLIIRNAGILETDHRIMVRYGDVIYPVESNTVIENGFKLVKASLESISKNAHYRQNQFDIVFLAPAHSIAVTPSRESLSMQEHTCNTLNKLFDEYNNRNRQELDNSCIVVLNEAVDKAVASKNLKALINTDLSKIIESKNLSSSSISDMQTLARQYMSVNYPEKLEFKRKDLTNRVIKLSNAGLLDRGLCQTYVKVLATVNSGYRTRHGTDWFTKRISGPLLGKLKIDPILSEKRLYVYDVEADQASNVRGCIEPAQNITFNNIWSVVSYLRKVVIVSRTRRDAIERAAYHPDTKEIGNLNGVLIYHPTMKQEHVDAALAFFKKHGMKVIDLTQRLAHEVVAPKVVKPKKPKVDGLVCLSAVKATDTSIGLHQMYHLGNARIEKPEFFVRVSLAQTSPKSSFPQFSSKTSAYIVHLFGSKGAALTTSIQEKKALAQGALPIVDYVVKNICAEIMTNPRIAKYYAVKHSRVRELVEMRHRDTIEKIMESPTFQKDFSLQKPNLSKDDRQYLDIFEEIRSNRYISYLGPVNESHINQAKAYLTGIPVDSACHVLAGKINASKFLSLINAQTLCQLIDGKNATNAKKAMEIFLTALNG